MDPSYLLYTMFALPALNILLKVGRLSVKPQDRYKTLFNPDFCESGAFGARLTALDESKLASLYHVCSASPNSTPKSGAAFSQASR